MTTPRKPQLSRRPSKRTQRQEIVAQDLVAVDDGGKFVWICEICHQPMGWGEGYITIDYPKVAPTRTYTWEVLCRDCDPNIDRYDYTIDVERCTTVEELIEWDRHLRGKQWIYQTNWWMIRGTAELALAAVGADAEVARIRRGLP